MMRNNKGITAFELAVTLAVLACVAALVMPPYLSWLRAYGLREATSTLMVDIEMAKNRAIRENDFVAVLFYANGYDIFVDNGAGADAGNYNRDAGERLLRNRRFKRGVRIDLDATDFQDDRTRFNGRGRISLQYMGAVRLVNPEGDLKDIDMTNRFGRITVN
jgi:Tfp pilus assembly protein FimT